MDFVYFVTSSWIYNKFNLHLYFQKRDKLESAIVDLCESFKKDIETLLAVPSLKNNEKAKTVLLIDAVNLNFLIL